jgi:ABC-type antimicrobial peptide transport system permease subunit
MIYVLLEAVGLVLVIAIIGLALAGPAIWFINHIAEPWMNWWDDSL